MRATRFVGPGFLLAGLVALAFAVARGEANVALIFIVPAVIGTGPLAFLGILLVFVGFFLTFLFWSAGAILPVAGPPEVSGPTVPGAARPRRWGGVFFLGPIPIVFGSDPEMTRMMLILGVILFIALLVLTIALLLA